MKILLHALTILFLCGLLPLAAQPPGAADDPPIAAPSNETEAIAREVGVELEQGASLDELTQRLDLREIIDSGGVIIYLLAAMSMVAMALVLYFFYTLNHRRISPTSFLREVQLSLKTGDFEEVRTACAGNASPVSSITAAAIDYLERAGEEADHDMLRQVVEGEGVRQVSRLQSQVTYLMDIGVIAPMVGLLGTVIGMLKSFSGVALNMSQAGPVVLANGVSQALVTTAAGLVVAIPAMMFYSFFRGRLAKLTANMELVAADIVTTLVHRKTT